MSLVFEGKEYQSVSAIKREYFQTRSVVNVSKYLKLGCSTVAEVVAMGIKVEAEGRRKALAGSKKSSFGGRTKTAQLQPPLERRRNENE